MFNADVGTFGLSDTSSLNQLKNARKFRMQLLMAVMLIGSRNLCGVPESWLSYDLRPHRSCTSPALAGRKYSGGLFVPELLPDSPTTPPPCPNAQTGAKSAHNRSMFSVLIGSSDSSTCTHPCKNRSPSSPYFLHKKTLLIDQFFNPINQECLSL